MQWVVGAAAGYATGALCNGRMPCRVRWSASGTDKPFKLDIHIHSATLALVTPGVMRRERPFVAVAVNEKTKETEPGDWSKEHEEWRFRESVTVEVVPDSEISIA